MDQTIVWDSMGKILSCFDYRDEAEEWIRDCGHQVLATTYDDGDVNITVMEMP